jgi:hypothetical protein
MIAAKKAFLNKLLAKLCQMEALLRMFSSTISYFAQHCCCKRSTLSSDHGRYSIFYNTHSLHQQRLGEM